MKSKQEQMSKTRKAYWLRFWGRCIIVAIMLMVYIYKRDAFNIAKGWNFFERFSPLHLLWGIWMWDMILQLIPIKAHISIGSQKIFASVFRPIKEKISKENLKKYLWDTTRSAYVVMLIWIVMNIAIGYLYLNGIIDVASVFMIPVIFYLCDLICVLIWCPFRLIVKTKCCTTCRIF